MVDNQLPMNNLRVYVLPAPQFLSLCPRRRVSVAFRRTVAPSYRRTTCPECLHRCQTVQLLPALYKCKDISTKSPHLKKQTQFQGHMNERKAYNNSELRKLDTWSHRTNKPKTNPTCGEQRRTTCGEQCRTIFSGYEISR